MVGDRDLTELARQAYAAMADSFSPCPAHLVPSFRLWHFPLAGIHHSWTVFHGRLEDPITRVPRLRTLSWDRDTDLERLELRTRVKPRLEPSLTVTEGEIDGVRLAELMAEVSRLRIPRDCLGNPYLTDERAEFGLEGFDVEGRDGRPIVRIEWDRDPPLEMAALAEWADRVRRWLREATSHPQKP